MNECDVVLVTIGDLAITDCDGVFPWAAVTVGMMVTFFGLRIILRYAADWADRQKSKN